MTGTGSWLVTADRVGVRIELPPGTYDLGVPSPKWTDYYGTELEDWFWECRNSTGFANDPSVIDNEVTVVEGSDTVCEFGYLKVLSPSTTQVASQEPVLPPPTTMISSPEQVPNMDDSASSRPTGGNAVPGPNILPEAGTPEFPVAVDKAIVDAEVKHSFDPEQLVEYEPATLLIELAVVSNGDGDDQTPADFTGALVYIAKDNNVTVTSAGCSLEAATSLTTAVEQGCDFYVPTPEQLGVRWTESISMSVTPLKADQPLTLKILVEPVVIIPNSDDDLPVKNPPITVTATANPGWEAHEILEKRAAQALSVGINGRVWGEDEQAEIALGESVDISAQLSIPDDVDPGLVDISELKLTSNKAAAAFKRGTAGTLQEREFTQTWSATPDATGTYVLSFAANATVSKGNGLDPLTCCDQALAERTLVVKAPPEASVTRAWNGTVTLAGGLATIIAVPAAIFGLAKRRRDAQTAEADGA